MRKLLIPLLCAFALSAADGPRRAPGFALPDSKMEVYDLADYRGKIVVLEFMQTTCPHCANFADVLREVERSTATKFRFYRWWKRQGQPEHRVAVHCGPQNHLPDSVRYGADGLLVCARNILEYPHVYLIDAKGMIHRDWVYSVTTKDVFEGKTLFTEIDRMLTSAATPAKK